MTSRARVIWLVVVFLAALVGIAYWQMARLSKGLRTMPAGNAGEILVGALSARMLAPGVDGTRQMALTTEPLLDQYQKNPKLAHQRYLLVVTWVHASQIFKTIDRNLPPEGEMLNSSTVPEIPQEERVDGWGKPYCILAGADRMTFLSGGGNVALNCESLRQTAIQTASQSTDSRLTRNGALLVAVYKRGEKIPTIRLD